MRTFIAILFLIIFGVASNVKPSYFYYWKANQKAIATEFCENKDKPVLKCNGKCYLKKKIELSTESQESKNSNSGNLRVPTIEYIPFVTDVFKFENIENFGAKEELISSNQNQIQSGYPNDCFKPPILRV